MFELRYCTSRQQLDLSSEDGINTMCVCRKICRMVLQKYKVRDGSWNSLLVLYCALVCTHM